MNKDPLEQLKAAGEKLRLSKDAPPQVVEEPTEPTENSEADTLSAEEDTQSPSPSMDVKTDVKEDESDDQGVPYKNRYHEAVRKSKKLEESLEALAIEVAALKETQTAKAFESLRGPGMEVATSTGTADVDPEPIDDAPVTKREVLRIVDTLSAKQQADALAAQRYPDLQNPNSLLYKETMRRAAEKRMQARRYGTSDPANDPAFVLETASAAYGELVASGKLVPALAKSADERSRREAVDSGNVLNSRGTTPAPKSAQGLTKYEELALARFQAAGAKITREQYIKRLNKRK